MKKILGNFGRFFVALHQSDEKEVRQSLLLVDSGLILPDNVFSIIIRNTQKIFNNTKVSVLSCRGREKFISDNFPEIEIIAQNKENGAEEYPLSARLFLLLLRRRFAFIVLPSLAVTLVSISLFFGRCPVFLHNIWKEWYRLRYRTVMDVLRGVRNADKDRRKENRGITDIFKSFGRIFVLLSEMKREDMARHILILDNGYTDIGYIRTAARRAQELFFNPDITLLTFEERKRYFSDIFEDAKIFTADEGGGRYRLAKQMLRMRKIGFDYVILTTLDVSPLIVSMLFMKTKVLLYNKWHQWWSLKIKGAREYLKIFINFLIIIPLFIYLFILAIFIFSGTRLRLLGSSLRKEN